MPKVCAGRQERDGAEHCEATAEIPFVLVLIGVLGGVLAFGLIGLSLGPIALAVLLPVWEWAEQLDARGSRETT